MAKDPSRLGFGSIRFRIVALFVAAMLALFVALAFLLWQQQRTAGSLEVLTDAYLPLSKVAARLDRDRSRVETDLERLVRDEIRPGTGTASLTAIYTDAFERNLQIGRTYVEKAKPHAPSAQERAVLNKIDVHLGRIDDAARQWEDRSRRFVELSENGQVQEARSLLLDMRATRDELGTETEQLVRLLDARIAIVTEATEAAEVRGTFVAVTLSLIALAFAIVSVGGIIVAVRPIGRLTQEVQRIAAGQAVGRVEVRGRGEVALLAREFNHMGEALRERDQRLTERAEELRRLSRYLASVLDSLEASLVVVEGTETTLANPAALQTFGANRGDPAPEVLASLGSGRHEVRHAGRLHEVRVSAFGEGGAVIVADDVTEQTATRERLARSERLATVGQMLAQITHEVRNPLNALSLNAELMADELTSLDGDRSTEAWDLLDIISTEIERLTQVTGHYLQLARRPRAQIVDTDIDALVEDVARLVRPELDQNDVHLDVVGPPTGTVPADGNQVRQALLNIVRNAVEAGAKRLELTIERAGPSVVLSVADDGPGMSEEEAERALDPFWSSKATGTGLGLAITKQIVEDHGGSLVVDSTQGKGTTIRLVLPAAL
ncbi:MAG: ATP-binding protein [Myxococcota bacterium]